MTCILAAIFLLAFLKPAPDSETEESSVPEHSPSIKGILSDRFFLIFLLMNVISMLVFFQLLSSIPVFLKSNLGIDEDGIGLIMAMNGLIIAATEMPIVYILENRMNSIRIIVIGTLLITLSFTVFLLGSWKSLAIISMLLITFGEILHMPFTNAFTMGRATKAQMGKYLSYYGMSYSIAFIFAPIIGLHIAESYSYDMLWLSMTVIGLVSMVGFQLLYRWSINQKLSHKTLSEQNKNGKFGL